MAKKNFNFENAEEAGKLNREIANGNLVKTKKAKEQPKEKLRAVQTYVGNDMYRRMMLAKATTGVKFGDMVLEALDMWLKKNEQ